MKNFHLIFSHDLTQEQITDAKKTFGIDKFIPLPKDLKQLWSNIPPELEDIEDHLSPIFSYIKEHIHPNDVALIQGDFGATYKAIHLVKSLRAIAVYATTTRQIKEKLIDNKVIKESIFKHKRYRIYA